MPRSGNQAALRATPARSTDPSAGIRSDRKRNGPVQAGFQPFVVVCNVHCVHPIPHNVPRYNNQPHCTSTRLRGRPLNPKVVGYRRQRSGGGWKRCQERAQDDQAGPPRFGEAARRGRAVMHKFQANRCPQRSCRSASSWRWSPVGATRMSHVKSRVGPGWTYAARLT